MSAKRYFEALSEQEDDAASPSGGESESPEPSTSQHQPPAAKRSKLEKGSDQSLTTLHVTKLPASVNTASLASHFATCGALKSCFVVSEKNNGPSRGFGYVAYADPKQAEQAIAKLNGSNLEGGKISVTWAKRRQREGEAAGPASTDRSSAATKKPSLDQQAAARRQMQAQQAQEEQFAKESDPRMILVVRGLGQAYTENPNDIEAKEDADSLKKALYKKVKKLAFSVDKKGDAQIKVEYPVNDSFAHVICPSYRITTLLSTKLNDHIFKSRFLTCYLMASHKSLNTKGKSAGGRLVIRNLPFTTTTDDLYALFASFGLIHSIDLPTDDKQRARGFAFVWYFKKDDAEAAMKKLNGVTVFGAKAEWSERIKRGGEAKKHTRLRKKREEFFGGKEEGDAQQVEAAASAGRAMAVDWAVSKDKFESAEQQPEPQQSKANEEEDSEDDDDDEDEDDDEEEEGSPVPEDLQEDEDDEAMEEDEDDEEEEGPKSSSDDYPTLFVRNIQFESTSADLHALFKSFGPVKYATIVTDHATNRSRGTGFVAFYTKEAADSVLKISESLKSTDFAQSAQKTAQNPFSAPSLILPDPSSSMASKVTLHGRVLDITPAVSKSKAESLRESNDKAKKPQDRRNLHLLHEGHFSDAQLEKMNLDKADAEARVASYEARRKLLRTNPSLYLSRSRLSIRQIPTFATDGVLRRLARHALKAFDDDVKAHQRKPLTSEELSEKQEGEGLGVVGARKQKVKADGTVLPPARVQQAKVLRQSDKIDPLTGLGKSKGYGFLELASHADALRVLRWVNANHEIGSLLKEWWVEDMQKMVGKGDQERSDRIQEKIKQVQEEFKGKGKTMKRTLIVEFSVENIQTVRRREQKANKTRDIASKRRSAQDNGDDDDWPPAKDSSMRHKKAEASRNKKQAAQSQRKAEAAVDKSGGGMGGVIGRKRKEKKARKQVKK